MKNRRSIKAVSERDMFVYNLWSKHNLTFKEIANYDVMGNLTRKTIANYVYSRASNTDKQRLIVEVADSLLPKFKSLPRVIDYIFENQPKCRLSEPTIRRIIGRCLRCKRNKI